MWPLQLQLMSTSALRPSNISFPFDLLFSKSSTLSCSANGGSYMANVQDQQDHSRWFRPAQRDTPAEEPSAYQATSTGYSQKQSSNLLVPSVDGRSKPSHKEKKKPTTLRFLMKKRPEEGTSQNRSLSLSPRRDAEPAQSAPPTSTSFPETGQRSVSQPPPSERVHPNQDAAQSGEYFDMSYADPGPSPPITWGPRPASTFPQAAWEPSPIDDSEPVRQFTRQPPPRAETSPPTTRHSPPTTRHSPPATRQPPPTTRQSPPATRQPPAARQMSVANTFDDPADFHLFVEATSGFSSGGFSLSSPQSPPRFQTQVFATPPRSEARPQALPPLPPQRLEPRPRQPPPRAPSPRQAPPPPRQPSPRPPAARQSPPRQPQVYQQQPAGMGGRPGHEPTASQAFAQSLEQMGYYDDEVPPDEELPNYAQSQAEAQEARRREAAQRAAELERRWADSRRRY